MSAAADRATALFELEPGLTYLDSASYGLPPRATVAALEGALAGWKRGDVDWFEWEDAAERTRERFAALIGARAAEIALLPAVSVATALALTSVPAGGEVLVPEGEFRSVVYPALVAERRGALTVREAPADVLADAVTARTRLVATSHVRSADGGVADLPSVVAAARAVGARVYLDATHSVGVVPARIAELGVDFMSCAAYKWLCCPRGTAFLFVREGLLDEVAPVVAGWRSVGHRSVSFYGGPLELTAGAAALDVSLAWHSWVGADTSLQALATLSDDERVALATAPARRLAELLELPPPAAPIVAVDVDPDAAVGERLAAAGVRASFRAGRVRLSTHIYNTERDAELAADVLRPHVKRKGSGS